MGLHITQQNRPIFSQNLRSLLVIEKRKKAQTINQIPVKRPFLFSYLLDLLISKRPLMFGPYVIMSAETARELQ